MPNTGQGNRPKTPEEYEAEATWVGACLVHASQAVARRVYEKRHGELPDEVLVCHECDNPQCILDEHHWLGTWQANMQDKVNKGRWRGGRPAVLSDDAVRDIRSGRLKRWEFAAYYEITVNAVDDIRSGRRRSNVL